MGYLRRRLLQAIVTLFSIVTLGFIFIRLIPGGPQDYLLAEIQANPQAYGLPPNPTMEQISQVLHERMNFQPDKPMIDRYIDYMVSAAQGDFGDSVIVDPGTSNMTLILERAPWTIFLSSVGLVYGLVAGIVFGSMMAYKEGSRFDVGTTTAIIFTGSVPYYIFAILLVSYFAWDLGWFPAGGRFNTDLTPGFNIPFVVSIFRHAALPMVSTVLLGFAGRALGLRANAIRILGSSYIRNAELRGLSSYTIATRYMARNAVLPMYTGIVLGLAGLLGGAVVLEEIFRYSGMGLLMFNASIKRDFPLLTAALIITTTIFIIGTIIADFTYALIDPRAEQSSMG